MEGSNPSDVRATILAQHQHLRALLGVIRRHAEQVLAGDQAAPWELRRRVLDLEQAFGAHLDTEEAIMVPLIESIDAWGPVRAETIRNEHREQRAILERASDEATSAAIPPRELAHAMIALVSDILADMVREEQDVLRSSLLRDDIIAVDQSSG